jgi:hypothetical protein
MRQCYIRPGEVFTHRIGYSEVALHLRVAGQVLRMELLPQGHSVQLYVGADRYSFPVLPSEAGLYWDNERKAYYRWEEPCAT